MCRSEVMLVMVCEESQQDGKVGNCVKQGFLCEGMVGVLFPKGSPPEGGGDG